MAELAPAIEHCDAVALLAYTPPRGQQSPLADERAVNVAGAGAIGGIAAEIGRPLVFASSADVYGDWHDEPVDELTTPRPRTPYARAKLEAEERLSGRRTRDRDPPAVHRLRPGRGRSEGDPVVHPRAARGRSPRRARSAGRTPRTTSMSMTSPRRSSPPAGGRRRCRSTSAPVSAEPREEVLEAVALAIGVEARARHVASPRAPTRLVLDNARARLRLGLDPRRDFVAALGEEAEWLARKRGVTVEVGA